MISNDSMDTFFHCTQCGKCCSGHGGTYVDEKKIKEIAGFLNISSKQLKANYLTLSSEQRYMIACGEDGKCVFFSDNCSIHPVKPRMCREWPFIPAVLREPENWEYMANACEGIKTNADKIKLREFILKSLEQTRSKQEIAELKIKQQVL